MTNFDSKIEYWQNRLLDLGKRNRLINSPAPKQDKRVSRSSIIIKEPDADTLWMQFADEDKPLEFPIPPADETKQDAAESSVKLIVKDDSITNQNIIETQKTLRTLKKKARTFAEEKGLNALYLAFGFLNWSQNEKTVADLRSPLLLVPVQLSQDNLFSPFVLSRYDDEIVPNYTLSQKLLMEYGIRMPDYSDETSFEHYRAEMCKVCNSMNWKVTQEVELSLFSFLKINMYQDLGNHTDKIKNHEIISVIAGEKKAVSTNEEILQRFDHDAAEPKAVFCVLDADSSQQDAIQLAKKGASFVLQGPPGTGKSQTITNIIAELLSDGKRVLFVSEKTAALDVVNKRLIAVGLGDFCLNLHSHNAKRREILDQLETSFKIAQNRAKLADLAFERLADLKYQRKLLNDYQRELHTEVMPLGKTIFQVNGKIAELHKYPAISFFPTNPAQYTQSDLENSIMFLTELSDIVAKSDYQTDNPWQGCTLPSITHKFRHDLETILQLTHEGQLLYSGIVTLFGVAESYRYPDNHFLTDVMDLAVSSPKVPYSWINSDIHTVFQHFSECVKNHVSRNTLKRELEKMRKQETVAKEALDKARMVRDKQFQLYTTGKENWNEECNKYSESYSDSIFDIDEAMLERFRIKYRSILRVFNSNYKADRRVILSCKKIEDKLSYTDILELLERLSITRKVRIEHENQRNLYEKAEEVLNSWENTCAKCKENLLEIEKQLKLVNIQLIHERQYLSSALGLDFNDTIDYKTIEKQLKWAYRFAKITKTNRVSREYAKLVCDSDHDILSQSKDLGDKFRNWVERTQQQIEMFDSTIDSIFEKPRSLLSKPFAELHNQVKLWNDNITALEYYIEYRGILKKNSALGMDAFILQAAQMSLPAEMLVPAFEKCFYRVWLDAVVPNYPAVQTFNRLRQEQRIKKFKELDTLHIAISKAALISKLISRLPAFDVFTSNYGEVGLLNVELKKKRKLLPTRKLIAALPNLLPALKPCMMMSPLSVSTYLGSSYEFDTVIFDEASQIRTEDAIGAIFRAKQTIIAGDSKQLPPSDFFTAATMEDDDVDDEEGNIDNTGAFESLIDEAGVLRSQLLKWHYRSRHEDLIAFSNAKIYKGELITFPSSSERSESIGVQYVHVPGGVYDRKGAGKGNHAEAEKVAALVFEHLRKNPKRSLGVIAFGAVQQDAITDALERKRRKDTSFEDYFKDDLDEGIFIKNLETVQGDERDTIIFSIGYAPDATGKFIMNFGPLSRDGGERRLNVAITRARYNLKLVGSIMPTDIDVERTSHTGPKLLRQYIDFAINGAKVILGEITDPQSIVFDSPFEEAVYHFLKDKGYNVATQVGCSGYRIDMAVRHPKYNGRFAIGIECDGAMYHSARTARERDRLRQTVLEDMGWILYRVWSTDWIKDQKNEGIKLTNAIDEAIANYREAAPHKPPQPAPLTDYLAISDRPKTSGELPKTKYLGYQAKDIPLTDFEGVMLQIVSQSFGIDKDGLFKATVCCYGWERQGSTIKNYLDQAYQKLLRSGKLKEIDGKINIMKKH